MMLGSNGLLTPLIPECSVLFTPGIFSYMHHKFIYIRQNHLTKSITGRSGKYPYTAKKAHPRCHTRTDRLLTLSFFLLLRQSMHPHLCCPGFRRPVNHLRTPFFNFSYTIYSLFSRHAPARHTLANISYTKIKNMVYSSRPRRIYCPQIIRTADTSHQISGESITCSQRPSKRNRQKHLVQPAMNMTLY